MKPGFELVTSGQAAQNISDFKDNLQEHVQSDPSISNTQEKHKLVRYSWASLYPVFDIAEFDCITFLLVDFN